MKMDCSETRTASATGLRGRWVGHSWAEALSPKVPKANTTMARVDGSKDEADSCMKLQNYNLLGGIGEVICRRLVDPRPFDNAAHCARVLCSFLQKHDIR